MCYWRGTPTIEHHNKTVLNLDGRGVIVIVGALESSQASGGVVNPGGVGVLVTVVAVAVFEALASSFFLWSDRALR